jgi:hypothetical protein
MSVIRIPIAHAVALLTTKCLLDLQCSTYTNTVSVTYKQSAPHATVKGTFAHSCLCVKSGITV